MKLKNIKDVNGFLEAVDKCKGTVTLTSVYGDHYCMKSELSKYVAIAALLGEHGDELEIWCALREDEAIIIDFLNRLQSGL